MYLQYEETVVGCPCGIVLLSYCIISIPFICSDTAIRVAKAIISAKVLPLCFLLVVLFHQFLARASAGLFSSWKPS